VQWLPPPPFSQRNERAQIKDCHHREPNEGKFTGVLPAWPAPLL